MPGDDTGARGSCVCCGGARYTAVSPYCRRCSVYDCPTSQDQTPRPCGHDPDIEQTTEQHTLSGVLS